MSAKKYDTIYQCSIDEYAKAHGTSVENLVKKASLDLKLMQEGKRAIFENSKTQSLSDKEVEDVMAINEAIEKKKTHIQRLKTWIQQKT